MQVEVKLDVFNYTGFEVKISKKASVDNTLNCARDFAQ